MCDYSLHLVASRPAKVGDTLVTTKFHAFTRGFSSVEDPNVAVCLLPGTELAFDKEVQYDTYDFWRTRRQVAHKVARFRQSTRISAKFIMMRSSFPMARLSC